MSWIRILWEIFTHPTMATFSRIKDDPKASILWGLAWMSISSLVAWFTGPLTPILRGLVLNNFGPQANVYFFVLGACISLVLGLLGLPLVSAIAHSLALLFRGVGIFRQLVFAWGILPLPFLIFLYLIGWILYLLRFFGVYSNSEAGVIVSIVYLVWVVLIYLYLIYSQVVAFSAVEQYGLGKGFGVILMAGVILGVLGFFTSIAYRVVMTNIILPYLYAHL